MLFDGCLKVMLTSSREEQQLLPPLEPNQTLYLRDLMPTQHFTQPPPRYTEATLVRVLEGKGIGRPSTYAPIISTVQERGYVRQEQRRFYATELGELVTDKLVAHFPTLINTDFTRQMEDKLDTIEAGKEDWVKTIDEFYRLFSADLEKASENMESEKGKPVETGITCDKCGKAMVYRWSRHGKFLGCSGYPDCKNTMQIEENGDAEAEPEIADEKCPLCTSPLIVKHGRKGKFLGCSNFPQCKFTKPIGAANIEIPEELKKCEKCGSPMIVRFSRRGPFLACSGYPQCKNVKPLPRKGEPESAAKPKTSRVSSKKTSSVAKGTNAAPAAVGEEKCENCGAALVEKTGRFGLFLACPNYPKCKFTKKIAR
jgi:DNA topoisomerase-1